MASLLKNVQDKLLTAAQQANKNDNVALTPSQRWVRASNAALIITSVSALAWLGLARTEEIITVPGKLQPIGRVSEVKAPMSGVVTRVLVKEGDTVKRGQLLVEFDPQATLQRSLSIANSIRLKEEQLILKDQQIQQTINQNLADQAMLANRLSLEQEIAKRLEGLQSQGASSRIQYLQQQSKAVETAGNLKKSRLENQRLTSTLMQERKALQEQLDSLKADASQQSQAIRYQKLVAAADGVVFDLVARQPGYVASPTETMLKIVPKHSLEAAVEIPSRYIGFVHTGQAVEISIDSYPSSDFGVLRGSVVSIGSDALQPKPEARDPQLLFPGRVSLSAQTLTPPQGSKLALKPGMSLVANLKLRKTSYLQLLLGDLADKTESVRRKY